MTVPDLVLDPNFRLWVLFPILFIMILFGLIRHYANILLMSKPKTSDAKSVREQQFLAYTSNLRINGCNLSSTAFLERQQYYSEQMKKGTYLKNPEAAGAPPSLTDPSAMDGMMEMAKGQAMNFVPQTIMMSWISALFSGFVLMRLPFPLTIRFKQMLQTGVATKDLDVRWVSAVSWYVLNLIGLKSVFALILGNNNTAGGAVGGPQQGPNMLQPGIDPSKIFKAEAENLDLMNPISIFDGIEDRILQG